MTAERANIHATAIVVGTAGVLFTGPSGSGKSALALACIAQARQQGHFAALIGDDQIFLSCHQGHVVAHAAPSICGLIEVRGSGIATVPWIASALLHLAVRPVDLHSDERLPPENEVFQAAPTASLPLIRVAAITPAPLAAIALMSRLPQLMQLF